MSDQGCPQNWYTEEGVRRWLDREGMVQLDPAFLAGHLQEALQKGWQLRVNTEGSRLADLEARMAEVVDILSILKRCYGPQMSPGHERMVAEALASPNLSAIVARRERERNAIQVLGDVQVWFDTMANGYTLEATKNLRGRITDALAALEQP